MAQDGKVDGLGTCERTNEHSGFVKRKEFLDQLRID